MPSSTTGSSAFSSGGASGFGSVSTTAAVVLDVEVLVEVVVLELDEVLDVELVVVSPSEIVVVVVGDVVAPFVVAVAAVDSSPHAANANNAALASANHPRRIVTVCQRSPAQQRRRSLLPAVDARWDADPVVAGSGEDETCRQRTLEGGDGRPVMWTVLREGLRPATDSNRLWRVGESQAGVELGQRLGQQLLVGQVQSLQSIAAE